KAGGSSKPKFVPAGPEAAISGSTPFGEAVAASDLRGRDDSDILLVENGLGSGDGASVYRNLRGGRFQPDHTRTIGRTFAKGTERFGIEILPVDLDGDGRPDLVAKDPNKVLIHWNDGSGTFLPSPNSLIAASSDAGNPRGGPDIPSATVIDA